MKTGCSPYNTSLNGDAGLSPPGEHSGPVSSISQLPTELVVKIFQFALPSPEFTLNEVKSQIISYMRTLYTIRLIAKRWQEIVDGTPTFWKFVMSSLPPHVNEATLSRSGDGPLFVIYAPPIFINGDHHPTPQDFVESLAHTFPRWSAYSGPLVPGYFHMPAPHLQATVLWQGGPYIGMLELLGGNATNLRHVDLSQIPIRWKAGLFTQLKVLKLRGMFYGKSKLTTTHLLDTLRASQGLEHLELAYTSATIDHPRSSPVITYPHLRYINFNNCHYRFAGAILRRIRAPSCTEFYLRIFGDSHEQTLSIFLNEDLGPFKDLLHAIHSRNGSSEMTLDGGCFGWISPAENVEHLPAFSVFMTCLRSIPYISWVECTLQGDPGLSIRFRLNPNVGREVLESIESMRCVTRMEIEDFFDVDECLVVLKFIGEPLSTDPALPSLPCLHELLLTGAGWTAQNVLDMVRSRFNSLLWPGTTRTPLTISISRGAFSVEGLPRPILDLNTLARIRETDGVECVWFVGSQERDGTLAITWDEKTSAPAWD
ncbi:hypothetical protein M407DRAFT_24204 [Tulasnella calospora MUT 4182]|uniref:F-box domain-containing protein n=1 Tax=Tulasnella calospora MUT 4182 TaxID=1051891 RepID=A0A0C3KYN2_9AGAM|nr:hypothetical protein M407DRAFT_24204 [Tulasnella calospora MUT 4182]